MDRQVVEVSSLSLSFFLFPWLPTYHPIYASIYLSTYLSICIYLSICRSIYLSVDLSIDLSVYLSLYLSMLNYQRVSSGNQIWQWKITHVWMFSHLSTFIGMSRCYVCLPEGKYCTVWLFRYKEGSYLSYNPKWYLYVYIYIWHKANTHIDIWHWLSNMASSLIIFLLTTSWRTTHRS